MKKMILVLALLSVPAAPVLAGEKDGFYLSSTTVQIFSNMVDVDFAFPEPAAFASPVQLWAGHSAFPEVRNVFGAALNLGWKRRGVPNVYGVSAGLLNTADRMAGIQAGFMNVAKNAYGAQCGLVNVADLVPLQLGLLDATDSGFVQFSAVNFAGKNVVLQAGVGNFSDNVYGAQVSLINFADSAVGVQAGTLNLAGSVTGIQLGIINMCDNLHGLQLGVLNISGEALLPVMIGLNVGF
ncbi:MAG: hypothetical protein WCS77_03245 [Elusimicrobiaceae bacterium]